MTKKLTLKRLESAGRVSYKRKPVFIVNQVKKLFIKHQNNRILNKLPSKIRFQCFYIWYVYFRMLSWPSFVDILNNSDIVHSVTKENRKKQDTSITGGLFGIAISGIVAGIAAAASKAAAATAATATIIGSSTAASTIATSLASGVGTALAAAATDAIIKEAT